MPSRPQPVLNATTIAAAVTVLAGVAAVIGVNVSPEDQAAVVSAAVGCVTAVSVVAHYVAAYRARGKVTPLANPVNAQGVALVPAPQISPRQDVIDAGMDNDTPTADAPAADGQD